MGISSEERAERIQDLELKRQSHDHEKEIVYRDEDKRRVQVRLLALRDEDALLKDKVHQKETQYQKLAKQTGLVKVELEEMKSSHRAQEAKFKKQTVDMGHLQTEIDSFGNSMQDSSKALQEKFALTRELDRIRPEMEHLKSQLANHQAVVAEKHSLQRQLDSLEVELENEKRSKARAHDKEDKADRAVIEDLKSQLEEAEKKLASNRKAHEREKGEASAHSEMLEERITGLKTKMKGTQSELKDAKSEVNKLRVELEKARTTASRASRDEPRKAVNLKGQAARKRAQESSFEDITIATPGNEGATDKRAFKKRGVDYGALGEKSVFSVTPFLNRSKDLVEEESVHGQTPHISGIGAADQSVNTNEDASGVPSEEADEAGRAEEASEEEMPPPPKPKATIIATLKDQKPRGRPKIKGLMEAPATKKNVPPVSTEESSKDPVSDDAGSDSHISNEQENAPAPKIKKTWEPKIKSVPTSRGPLVGSSLAALAAEEGKKKKRKLLGGASKTLVDEDDADNAIAPVSRPVKAQMGMKRTMGAAKTTLGAPKNAFGGKTFSPLKRDRRGVQASFLA